MRGDNILARTMTTRIKDWRNKKVNQGGKSLTVMLEPDTAILFEDLKEKYQESNARLVARALKRLAESFTCKQPDAQVLEPSSIENFSVEKSEPSSADSIHPSLKDIKKKICQGATVLSQKEKIKQAMKEMRSQGYDSSGIVALLFEAKIKTITGNEKWESGTVRKWWK
jgi:hypothetical protein